MMAHHDSIQSDPCPSTLLEDGPNHKVLCMKRKKTFSVLLLLLLVGCASLSKANNYTLFQEVHRAYRMAIRDSDFKAANLAVAPAAKKDDSDFKSYMDIKIARYKIIKSTMNDEGSEVRQEVEIQYYRKNRPVVKYLWDNQLWRYQADKSTWFLQTGLPVFPQ